LPNLQQLLADAAVANRSSRAKSAFGTRAALSHWGGVAIDPLRTLVLHRNAKNPDQPAVVGSVVIHE
jgi:hypothetical protein